MIAFARCTRCVPAAASVSGNVVAALCVSYARPLGLRRRISGSRCRVLVRGLPDQGRLAAAAHRGRQVCLRQVPGRLSLRSRDPSRKIGTGFRTLGYDSSLDHGVDWPEVSLPQQATEPLVITPQMPPSPTLMKANVPSGDPLIEPQQATVPSVLIPQV